MSATAPRSSFVTAIAWTFIVLSGLGVVIGLLQNLMVHMVLRPMLRDDSLHGDVMAQMPAVGLMFEAMPWFFLGFFLVSVLGLAASVGLLRRRPWGRRLFIVLMGLLILWQVAGFTLQFVVQRQMQAGFVDTGMPPETTLLFVMMPVVAGVFALAFIVLFGWIIHRLTRPALVAEFTP